jgi:WXG100 family type VII secretion target
MTLVLDHAPYDRCRGAVAAAAERLAADRDRTDARVRDLLAAGWRGRAAESFADAWADWTAAAGDVADSLATMAALLDAVHRDVTAQDDRASASLGAVTARLAERLGR